MTHPQETITSPRDGPPIGKFGVEGREYEKLAPDLVTGTLTPHSKVPTMKPSSKYPTAFWTLVRLVESGQFTHAIRVPLPGPINTYTAKNYANQWHYFGKALRAEGLETLARNHDLIVTSSPKDSAFVTFSLRDEDAFAQALAKELATLTPNESPEVPHESPIGYCTSLKSDGDPYAEPQDPFADYFK